MGLDWHAAILPLHPSFEINLAISVGIAGLVWKAFEKSDSILSERARLEIAVWLVGVEVGATWRKTISAYLCVIGGTDVAMKRPLLLAGATSVVSTIALAGSTSQWVHSSLQDAHRLSGWDWLYLHGMTFLLFVTMAMIGIACCLERVWASPTDRTVRSVTSLLLVNAIGIALYLLLIVYIAVAGHSKVDWSVPRTFMQVAVNFPLQSYVMCFFLCTTWLWLYCIAALILKGALRFDRGVQAFARICDIEKKPLQSIGTVASVILGILCLLVVSCIA
jgi:hypothetical protein